MEKKTNKSDKIKKNFNTLVNWSKKQEKINNLILKISDFSTGTKDLKSLLPKIYNEFYKIIPTKNFYIALYYEDKNLYNIPFSIDEFDVDDPDKYYDLSFTLTDYVRIKKTAMLINSESHKKLFDQGFVKYYGTDSTCWLGAPLKINKKVNGVIAIQEYSSSCHFTTKDLDLLRIIANHIAFVINKIKNEETLINYNKELEKRIQERTIELLSINKKLEEDYIKKVKSENIQRVLFEISNSVTETKEISELYKIIHKIVNSIIKSNNFYIAILNEEKQVIDFPYFVDECDKLMGSIPFGQGITSYVLKKKKNIIINEQEMIRLSKEGIISLVGTPSKIWAGIILKIQGKPNGVMVIQNYESENAIGENEIKILTFISEQVSQAINRKIDEIKINNFLTELTEKQKELEKTYNKLLKTNEKLKASELQLKESNNSKDKFFSIIAHDLKSPFQSLLGSSDLLLLDFDELSKEELQSFIFDFNKSLKSLFNLTSNLLEWSRLVTGKFELNPELINIQDRIDYVMEPLKTQAIQKEIVIKNELQKKIYINCDKFVFDTVLRNLIGNAIKFSFKDSHILINAKKDKHYLYCSVKDNGVGMNEEEVTKLFRIDSNFSTRGTLNERGTGLGLLLCKELIEKAGGTIIVISEPMKGTTFEFSIPLNGNH